MSLIKKAKKIDIDSIPDEHDDNMPPELSQVKVLKSIPVAMTEHEPEDEVHSNMLVLDEDEPLPGRQASEEIDPEISPSPTPDEFIAEQERLASAPQRPNVTEQVGKVGLNLFAKQREAEMKAEQEKPLSNEERDMDEFLSNLGSTEEKPKENIVHEVSSAVEDDDTHVSQDELRRDAEEAKKKTLDSAYNLAGTMGIFPNWTGSTYLTANGMPYDIKMQSHVNALKSSIQAGVEKAMHEVPERTRPMFYRGLGTALDQLAKEKAQFNEHARTERIKAMASTYMSHMPPQPIQTQNIKKAEIQSRNLFYRMSKSIIGAMKNSLKVTSDKMRKVGKFFKEDVPFHVFGKTHNVMEMLRRNHVYGQACMLTMGVVGGYLAGHLNGHVPHAFTNGFAEHLGGVVGSNDVATVSNHLHSVAPIVAPTTIVSDNLVSNPIHNVTLADANLTAPAPGVTAHHADVAPHAATVSHGHTTHVVHGHHVAHKQVDGLDVLSNSDAKLADTINKNLHHVSNPVHVKAPQVTADTLNAQELDKIHGTTPVQVANTHKPDLGQKILNGFDYTGNAISDGAETSWRAVSNFFTGNSDNNVHNVVATNNINLTRNPYM